MKARENERNRTSTGGAGVAPCRSSRRFRGSLLAALLLAVGHLPATERALADDFDRLVASADSEGTVSVLVTGWQAVTGDELNQGSRGNGPVAITGDELVRDLEAAAPGVSVTRRYRNFPVLAMEMDAAALRAAKSYGSGVEVWDDPVLEPFLEESVEIVGAPEAWRGGYAGRGLAIAVIDDGVDTRHPFLAKRTVFEGCFADICPNGRNRMLGRGAAFPTGSHGTHVAGIALGGAVDEDLAGVGPDLRLIILRASNARTGGFSGRNILASLDVVLTLAQRYPGIIGAVNMSLGAERKRPGVCRSPIWDYASQLFRRVGVPVVVASGNGSKEHRAAPVGFPACIEGFISVGAVTKSEEVASFSNSGPGPRPAGPRGGHPLFDRERRRGRPAQAWIRQLAGNLHGRSARRCGDRPAEAGIAAKLGCRAAPGIEEHRDRGGGPASRRRRRGAHRCRPGHRIARFLLLRNVSAARPPDEPRGGPR